MYPSRRWSIKIFRRNVKAQVSCDCQRYFISEVGRPPGRNLVLMHLFLFLFSSSISLICMFEKKFFQSVNYCFVNFGEDKEELLSIFSSQIQYDLVSTAQGIMKFQNEQFSKYFRLSPNNSTLSFQTAITFSLAPNFGKLRRPCEEY